MACLQRLLEEAEERRALGLDGVDVAAELAGKIVDELDEEEAALEGRQGAVFAEMEAGEWGLTRRFVCPPLR